MKHLCNRFTQADFAILTQLTCMIVAKPASHETDLFCQAVFSVQSSVAVAAHLPL
jgi:hypothetical protein